MDNRYCPSCGKPTTFRDHPEWLLGHWKGRYARMLAALLVARRIPRGLAMDELVKAAYIEWEDPTKIPVNAEDILLAVLATERTKLNTFKWNIVGPRTTGNGYWLVPLDGECT